MKPSGPDDRRAHPKPSGLLLAGINHRTAAVELRERVVFSPEDVRRANAMLFADGAFREIVILSTCNRSELYAVANNNREAADADLRSFLFAFHRLDGAEVRECAYQERDRDVVRHIFRVASGLDSQLLGEAEILGQVRQAYQVAVELRATGPILNRLFQAALEVGKRVRSETGIGTRPMSVAFAGVKLAEQVFGRFRGHTALIVGAGAVGEQVIGHLRDRGIGQLLVTNRSFEHARETASRFSGEPVEWAALERVLVLPDVVICSTASPDRIVSRFMVERAMAARGNRPLLIVDLGVPRNVDPAVGELYNVYVYSTDDLSAIVENNKKAREREIPRVEAIIDDHVRKYDAWLMGSSGEAGRLGTQATHSGPSSHSLSDLAGEK